MITKAQSISLSVIRVLSMCLIVACHITQKYDMPIAFLLNIGVQIFFFTSGFLYGKLEITSIKDFIKKRFTKVYIPYFLVILLLISGYTIFSIESISIKQIVFYLLNIQYFTNPIGGGNHLWFLTVIMLCYAVTPLLQRIIKKNPIYIIVGLLIFSIIEFGFIQKLYSLCASICLYIFGMLIGRCETKKINITLNILSGIIVIGLFSIFTWEHLTSAAYKEYNTWLHFSFGIFIFISLYNLLPFFINENKEYKLLKQADSISYEVYLVHHPIILGPLSLLLVTPYNSINILIVLLLSVIMAYALKYCCSFINSKL
jgi:peptidoglycan/LPS O-acetylase OafA/YrhL